MKRRDKGSSNVYRRPDGRYIGEHTDADGKRRYVSGKNDVKAKLKGASRIVRWGYVSHSGS